jgi:Phosphodiester glycosidase
MKTALFAALLTLPAAAMAQPLFDGITYSQKVKGGEEPMIAHIITIDLARPGIKLALTSPDRSKGMEHIAYTTSSYLKKTGAQVAVNASYFLPFNGGSPKGEDFYPKEGEPVQVSGMTRGGGKPVSPVEIDLDNRVTAIICITGADIRINDGQRCTGRATEAVSAGPRLLTAGANTPLPPYEFSRDDAKGPRTAFGLSADRKTAWLVVIDGRQAGYSMGASLPELTALFRELGASDAINLDGGGSSAMVVAGKGGEPELLSRPIHTGVPGRERPVANHIVVFAKALPAPAAK